MNYEINGEMDGRRFVVICNGERHTLQRATFEYFLELVTAAFETSQRYLPHVRSLAADRNAETCRTLRYRLASQLQIDNITENGNKAYRLSEGCENIHVDPGVYDLDETIVDRRIIDRLYRAIHRRSIQLLY